MNASLNPSQLAELCAALGCQGGTYPQVLADVQRLVALAADQQAAILALAAAREDAEDVAEACLAALALQLSLRGQA